jgi:hypothetical protein
MSKELIELSNGLAASTERRGKLGVYIVPGRGLFYTPALCASASSWCFQ